MDDLGAIWRATNLFSSRVYGPISRNKRKFICYAGIALLIALLLSIAFGDNYNGKKQKLRGSPRVNSAANRVKRQAKATASSNDQQPIKDPFPNRPRIQTRNGHLLIEASQDKNIDFKTSGSRGSVTINGHKLDQLLDVSRALEGTAQAADSRQIRPPGDSGLLSSGKIDGRNRYESLLRTLYSSGEQLVAIERALELLKAKLDTLDKLIGAVSKKASKSSGKLAKLDKAQESLVAKLKHNNCFDSDTGAQVCKNGATCLSGFESFKCLCPSQFEGPTCAQDVDECSKFRGTDLGCQNGAKCENLVGGYRCECTSQFHGVHCTELHEDCAMSSSRSLCGYGKCLNLARTIPNQARYECICDQGWTTDGTNPACIIDINECLVGQQQQNGSSIGGSAITWSNSLMAAYPCSQNPFVECLNLPGSFQCASCPTGYSGNGRICRDINECNVNNGGCSQAPPVECINTEGSRRCGQCPAGYTGDGFSCVRSGACSSGGDPNGGCHLMARCVELQGVATSSSRLCICQYPYTGNGLAPDGCRLIPGSAGAGPFVMNPNSSSMAEVQMPAQSDNDCSPNPCLNGATCRQTAYLGTQSFECLCEPNWYGRLCDEQLPICGGQFLASKGSLSFPRAGSFAELLKMIEDKTSSNSSNRIISTTTSSSINRAPNWAANSQQLLINCKWTILVANSMSIKLTFGDLLNKVQPNKRVQVWLAKDRQAANHSPAKSSPLMGSPSCTESVDVWERSETNPSEGRLLARFCTSARAAASSMMSSIKPGQQVSIVAESSQVQVEYSFEAPTRTQFPGEPSLMFALNWTQTEPACGGDQLDLQIADSGSVSSPKFPDFYQAGTECRYILRVPPGKRIRLQFGELNLLSLLHGGDSAAGTQCADSLVILDGLLGSDRAVLFNYCANNATLMSKAQPLQPIVSSSSTVELILTSNIESTSPLMRPNQRKGFYLTYSSEPSSPGCGGLYSERSALVRSADYEPRNAFGEDKDSSSSFGNTRMQHFEAGSGNRFELNDSEVSKILTQSPNWESLGLPGNSSSRRSNDNVRQQQRPPVESTRSTTRCDYQIRPPDRSRDHKIALDWLEMPAGDWLTKLPQIVDENENSSRMKLYNAARCQLGRLIVYDGTGGGSERTELATFCAGDRYNSSNLQSSKRVVSSGHSLLLVYESRQLHYSGPSFADTNKPLSSKVEIRSLGFKLRYSTVCVATYQQLAERISVQLEPEVPECIYHIYLPANNTISLNIETQALASSSMLAADQSCAAQAIFLDGAIEGGKAALEGVERQLKSYNFNQLASDRRQSINSRSSASSSSTGDEIQTSEAGERVDSGANFYWQYSSSNAHDIKEFEVCKLPVLSFDSAWNHLSLLFRLKDSNGLQLAESEKQEAELPREPAEANRKVQLSVKYQAEPSCGGIISEPSEGSFKMESSRKIQSLGAYPITANRFEQLHKQSFLNPCAWILKAESNQAIQVSFQEAPIREIKRQFSDWLNWRSRKSPTTKQQQVKQVKAGNSSNLASNNSSDQSSESIFDCNQVFQESIELYEPVLNRTRYLCPSDLASGPQIWSSQSNILYIRLTNQSDPLAGQQLAPSLNTSNTWPGKRALNASNLLVHYRFSSSDSQQCGGRLIQDSGIIKSPNWPYKYPPGAYCVWLIQTKARQQIRLNFTHFQLESSTDCWLDYLELRNGPSRQSPLIGRFCSSDLQSKVIISQSNLLRLTFSAYGRFSGSGFEIHYDGAQTGCGGRLSTASGQIDSPNFPKPYAHAAQCEWIIEVNQANQIELKVSDLDLSVGELDCETSANASSKTAMSSNYLEIFDSGPEFLTRSLGRFCHLRQLASKRTFRSSGNKLMIVYRSQALDYGRGFRLAYESSCSEIELTGHRGVIESAGFPALEDASSALGLNCSWLIRAPLGSNVTLSITDLEMSASYSKGSAESKLRYKIYDMDLLGQIQPNTTSELRELYTKRKHADVLEIWAIDEASNSSQQQVEYDSESKLEPGKSSESAQWLTPKRGKLVKLISGDTFRKQSEGETEPEADKTGGELVLNANLALVRFKTSPMGSRRALRIEWLARGCGSQQVGGESIAPLIFQESSASDRPIECWWTYDLSKVANTLELHLNSDMRSLSSQSQARKPAEACQEASLTVYDGLTEEAPILSQNCDSQKVLETVLTSSGQALVRFYAKSNHNYARSFSLTGWPSSRDGCLASVFDISTPYNRPAGSKSSPNYPDLYDSAPHRCFGMLSVHSGRLRIWIEELDIPTGLEVGEGEQTPAGGEFPDSERCRSSGNYLVIRSLQGRQTEELFCGHFENSFSQAARPIAQLAQQQQQQQQRSTSVVLEQEAAWMEFYSRGGQRGRWKISYERLCGSIVQVDSLREFSSPNYPSKPDWSSNDGPESSRNVCVWRLKTNYPQSAPEIERKLHLSIVNFMDNLESQPDRQTDNCLRVYEGVNISMKQDSFNLTKIDLELQPKVKICRQSDVKHSSLSYVSRGNELTVLISGSAIAKFRVKPFENYCGGEFHLDKAEFASLNYPQPYSANLDCHYFVVGSPGSQISLKFLDFDLPEEENTGLSDSDSNWNQQKEKEKEKQAGNCDNVDYIEIRQISLRKKLRSRLRLNQLQGSSNSTIANATNAIGTKLSPLSQQRFSELAKLYFMLFESAKQSSRGFSGTNWSSGSMLMLPSLSSPLNLDDFYENSELIGRYCGKKAPKFFDSTGSNRTILQDEILIRFRSHGGDKKTPRGFLAEYKINYGHLIKLPDERSMAEGGLIGSPRYPVRMQLNDSVRWTFETRLDSVIQFDLVHIELGNLQQNCLRDSLSIFDGLNPATTIRLAQFCGHLSFRNLNYKRRRLNFGPYSSSTPIYLAHDKSVRSSLIRSVRSSSNVATLVFDNFQSEGLFLIRYKATSKAELALELAQSQAQNSTTNNLADLPIEAGEAISGSEGAQRLDRLIGGGNASRSCSQKYKLSLSSPNSSQILLSSPNWPSQAPHDIECHWLVYTTDNSNIQLAISPSESMLQEEQQQSNHWSNLDRKPDYCLDPNYGSDTKLVSAERRDFVIVHDGATRLAPILGRFCLPAPPMEVRSSGRHLFVRYVRADLPNESLTWLTDKQKPLEAGPSQANNSNSNLGLGLFRARASVGQCGGQYHILSQARIRDRDSNKANSNRQTLANYENNLNCRYYLFAASQDKVLVIHHEMSEFDLAPEPTNADCSIGDYIEIRDLPLAGDSDSPEQSVWQQSGEGRSLGRFCAGRKLELLESPGAAISVEFHTDGANVARGWELFVMSAQPRASCPRGYTSLNVEEPFGRITSPNWPHGFRGKRHCKYYLAAPANQTISLKFVRLNRPLAGGPAGEQVPMGEQRLSGRQCADNFQYLADNEASSLRYAYQPLREINSPLSGSLIRKLVREIPCRNWMSSTGSAQGETSQTGSQMRGFAEGLALDGQVSAADETSSERGSGLDSLIDSPGAKKISALEYLMLSALAPAKSFRIQTRSHILILDYETENLLQREGFVAIYRLNDNRNVECGGEIGYEPPASQPSAPGSGKRKSLIESGRFNVEAKNESDEFIQCDWTIRENESRFTDYLTLGIGYNSGDPIQAPATAPVPVLVGDQVAQVSAPGSETFKTNYIVFDALEIPPAKAGLKLADEDWSSDRAGKSSEICGLNRLLITDGYFMRTLFACGNLTGSYRWLILDYNVRKISLRTKNLRVTSSEESAIKPSSSSEVDQVKKFHRGVRAFYYEKSCQQMERLIGEAGRFKSHANLVNSSYSPGICRWDLRLNGGDYELWFDKLKFRAPEGANARQNESLTSEKSCDPNREADLDYIELRASFERNSPLISRFCYHNQLTAAKQRAFMPNMRSDLSIIFVAGLRKLAQGVENFAGQRTDVQVTGGGNRAAGEHYGFDMQLVRIRNESADEFCRRDNRYNIYWLIRSRELSDGSPFTFSPMQSSFLYPNRTHCVVELNLDEGSRFNFTFRGIFDLEDSLNCSNDYIQIDNLRASNSTNNTKTELKRATTSTRKPSSGKSTTPKSSNEVKLKPQVLAFKQPDLVVERIGRWCGRTRPIGNFVSKSEQVRITFHSNERIEGKGFQLEYGVIPPASDTTFN